MGRLMYGMGQVSLDGYVADRNGTFDWAEPGEDLHRHAAAELASIGTAIYGRRMYEVMVFWETAHTIADFPPEMLEFAVAWQAQDKIVASSTLAEASTARTRLVRDLTVDDVRALKAETTKDISVAGPTVASALLGAGLVDEVSGYFLPLVVGGGLPMFIVDHDIELEQTEELALEGGYTFKRFAVRR